MLPNFEWDLTQFTEDYSELWFLLDYWSVIIIWCFSFFPLIEELPAPECFSFIIITLLNDVIVKDNSLKTNVSSFNYLWFISSNTFDKFFSILPYFFDKNNSLQNLDYQLSNKASTSINRFITFFRKRWVGCITLILNYFKHTLYVIFN